MLMSILKHCKKFITKNIIPAKFEPGPFYISWAFYRFFLFDLYLLLFISRYLKKTFLHYWLLR